LAKVAVRVAIVTAIAMSSCGRSPLDLPPADPVGGSSSGAGMSGTSDVGGGAGAVDMSGPACGGHRCAATQVCCVLNGLCIEPASARTVCPMPTTLPVPGPSPGTRLCGSNADCDANEFCSPSIGCLSAGTCQDRSNCGTSTGTMVCGCDGKSYPNVQTACAAGIKTQEPGACGSVSTPGDAGHDPVIFCGSDTQCPTGFACCAISGRCVDPSLFSALCVQPPAGTLLACLSDRQCLATFEFCNGPGCSGPGGCTVAGGECSGVLDPVCGCDGQTYTDASCTPSVPTRIAHAGACTPP
jgi:hypothetical protein